MTLTRGVFAAIRPSPQLEPPTDEWRTQAACRDVEPDLFFMESRNGVETAKSVCAECPVKLPCLAGAMDDEGKLHAPSRFGVRGGLTPLERANLARRRNRAVNRV